MEVIYKCLTGSHCQGLATENSDYDYKCLALPTPEEMVRSRQRCKQIHNENGCDYDIHDLRDFTELMRKSNPTYLEILWPQKVILYGSVNRTLLLHEYLFKNRNRIAAMNTESLYRALDGMYNNRMGRIYKDPGEKGYNGKNACHALRCAFMTTTFADNGFTDFGKSIYLPDDIRDILLDIKNEKLCLGTVEEVIRAKRKSMLECKVQYVSRSIDKDMITELRDVIDRFVWSNVRSKDWNYKAKDLYKDDCTDINSCICISMNKEMSQ